MQYALVQHYHHHNPRVHLVYLIQLNFLGVCAPVARRAGTPTVGIVIGEVVQVHVHEAVAARSPTGLQGGR
jgi:hypothetical protein